MVASNRLNLTDNHTVRIDSSDNEGCRSDYDEDEQTLPLGLEVRGTLDSDFSYNS